MTISATSATVVFSSPLDPILYAKKRPRLFKCTLSEVVIESHSQMHLVIFHYFIAWLHSPARHMFISSNHHLDWDLRVRTHTQQEKKFAKKFPLKRKTRMSWGWEDWMNLHLTWKGFSWQSQKHINNKLHHDNNILCIKAFFILKSQSQSSTSKKEEKIVYSQVHFKDVFLDLVARWMHFVVCVVFIGRGLANIEKAALKIFANVQVFFSFLSMEMFILDGVCLKITSRWTLIEAFDSM